MKKTMLCVMLAAAAALGLTAANALADAEKGVAVVLTGENYCLLCAFGAEDAKAEDEALAHLNGLKVTAAETADGEAIAGWEGKTVHYLPSKSAQALHSGEEHAGKTVTVTGTLFKNASVLLVASFEVTGDDGGETAADDLDDWDWDFDDLPVQSLSGQQVL